MIKLLSDTSSIPNYHFDQTLRSNSFSKNQSHASLTDCINMITIESNPNDLINKEEKYKELNLPIKINNWSESIFQYFPISVNETQSPVNTKKLAKSSSMMSLKHQSLYSSEVKTPKCEYTPVTVKRSELSRTQRKQPLNNMEKSDLLDYNISTVLSKLKSISTNEHAQSHSIQKRKYSKSCCNIEDPEPTSSFISYKKNKYSKIKEKSWIKKNPDLKNYSESKSKPSDNKFLSYLNSVKKELNLELMQEREVDLDKIEYISINQNMSDKETCEKETVDAPEESYDEIIQHSIHSSNISDSYQSFSTINQERSECMVINQAQIYWLHP